MCEHYYFVAEINDTRTSSHRDANRSCDHAWQASDSSKNESEDMDHMSVDSAASCSKLSSCSQRSDCSLNDDAEQVTGDSQCRLMAKKMDMQDVFAALPFDAKEQKCTETGSKSCHTQPAYQTRAAQRLFHLSVQTIRDNAIQSGRKVCSETELASNSLSQTEDSNRRNKRCKLSTSNCDVSSNAGECGAHGLSTCDSNSINKEGSAVTLVDNSEKTEKLVQRENTADCYVAANVPNTTHFESHYAKGKQKQAVCSAYETAEFMEVKNVTCVDAKSDVQNTRDPRELYSHKSSFQPNSKAAAPVAVKPYDKKRHNKKPAAETQGYCDLHSPNDSFQPSAKEPSVAAKRCDKKPNNKKPVVKNVTSHESVVKPTDGEIKAGESKYIILTQRGRSRKETGNKGTIEAEARKLEACCKKAAEQTSQDLLHSAHHQKQSTCVRGGIHRSNAQSRPKSITENRYHPGHSEDLYDNGRRYCTRSTRMSANYRSSTSNLKEDWATALDDCHTGGVDRVATRCQYRGSTPMVPVRQLRGQKYSRKSVVSTHQHSGGIDNGSENVCSLEDWEADLYPIPPCEHNVAVVANDAVHSTVEISSVNEAVRMTTSLYTDVSDRSVLPIANPAEWNIEEASDSPLQPVWEAETSVDHNDNQVSSSSSDDKMSLDCGREQTRSEIYDAVADENCFIKTESSQTVESSDTTVRLKHDQHVNVEIEREIDVVEYDTQTVNCHKPNMDEYGHNCTIDRKQMSLSLPRDLDFSNMPSDSAELREPYEIMEPYDSGADADDSVYCLQSDKCCDEVLSGK